MTKKIAIITGPPGSGKSTAAETLRSIPTVDVIITGRLLREESLRGTPIGERVRPAVETGELAPAEDVAELIRRHMQILEAPSVILTGFPANKADIDAFFDLVGEMSMTLNGVIILAASDEVLCERMEKRGMPAEEAQKCLHLYRKHTFPVEVYFRDQFSTLTHEVNADQPIKIVYQDILAALWQCELDVGDVPGADKPGWKARMGI